jgi:Tol biopolymer transport system component/predicted Ser/Thr protein kinase
MPLIRGARIGPYEIVEPLGAGGMGEVYRAWDPKLARDVAIKVLNRDTALNPVAIRRFEQEARVASALNHPGIITIHDTGESNGQFFIVMEMVDGQSLRHLLLRGRPPLKKALQIASQLADALAKAHESGIVHRDLKPENVMISSDGHVKIVDFGLAKLAEPLAMIAAPAADGMRTSTSTVSSRGQLLGTIGYMSPEQASGEDVDFRADQFAFGAVLYELTTGARAFRRATSVETLAMIISGEPERLLTLNPSLPLPVVWTIERCLSKDPADRFASTRDLARDVQTLRDHASDLDALERPLSGLRARRSRLAAGVILAAIAMVVGVAAYYAIASARNGAAAAAAPVSFKQLTFRRGYITNARFMPDGHSILYAANWHGGPIQLFETRSAAPESRSLAGTPAGLASISPTGELALIRNCRLDWGICVGTLATMPLGGAPRDVLEDVISADWAPDGRALTAVQVADGEYRLQFPIGKQLYATAGKMAFVRFSPSGDRLALVEYPLLSEENGVIKVFDLDGRATTISGTWKTIRGIDWSPDGSEIWLYDVGGDRGTLITHGLPRSHMMWSGRGGDRELSWLDWSTVADLSVDGSMVLFYEWGQAVGATPVVYIRSVDGSDAVRLGEGKALALSPDGRWALALQEGASPHLILLPTGAGEGRPLPAGALKDFYWAKWFPDGRRLLVVGSAMDGAPASYIQDVDTGRLERIAESGMLAALVAPDGARVLVNDPLEGYFVWPLSGGKPMPVRGMDRQDRPLQWSADGRFLYLRGPDEDVLRIDRLNLANGKRELWKTLAPADPSGIIGVATGRGEVAMTQDGAGYVFTYWTALRNLYLVEGIAAGTGR